MESLNDTCPESNNISNLYVILSISSWLLVIITCWMPVLSLGISKNRIFEYIWMFYIRKEKSYYYEDNYIILDINFEVFCVITITTFIITTLGFLIYIYSLYKGDKKVINGMLDGFSKFHFIPLLCIASLFIIGESYYTKIDVPTIFSLIFTCLAIISLAFISFKTKIYSPWYAVLTINKGTYSCFFYLLTYNFGYVLSNYIFYKKGNESGYYYDDIKDIPNFFKRSYLAFSILIGIFNNTASVLLKDYMIALINLLIYLGMTINYYKRSKEFPEYYLYKRNVIGIIDIIMMVLSFLCICFHVVKFKGIIPSK